VKYSVTVAGRTIDVEVDGEQVTVDGGRHTASLIGIPGTPLRQLLVDGRPLSLVMVDAGGGRWEVIDRGERVDAEVVDERTRHIRGLTGGAGGPATAPSLRAPMPGMVVRIQVEAGQAVAAGGGVIVLEAMKMENELRAQADGVVKAVRVRSGEAVEKGQVLVEYE
jgi:biotin carboxyl carrier protein